MDFIIGHNIPRVARYDPLVYIYIYIHTHKLGGLNYNLYKENLEQNQCADFSNFFSLQKPKKTAYLSVRETENQPLIFVFGFTKIAKKREKFLFPTTHNHQRAATPQLPNSPQTHTLHLIKLSSVMKRYSCCRMSQMMEAHTICRLRCRKRED